MSKQKYYFVLKGYPRLSETFIAQEIHLLEQRGFDITILAMRKPRENMRQPIVAKVRAPVVYIPEYIHLSLGRMILACLKVASSRPRRFFKLLFSASVRSISATDKEEIKRFLQATWCLANCDFTSGEFHLHSHFVHSPTTLTRYLHHLTDIPYSISAHAKDIYTIETEELTEKVNGARFLTTCTSFNAGYIKERVKDPEKVRLAYHGIDTEYFKPVPGPCLSPVSPLSICTISRLVEKKGYDVMLKALGLVKQAGVDFQFDIFGTGEMRDELDLLAESLDIDKNIVFHGALPQNVIRERLLKKGLFLCGAKISKNGDRDGIPNSLAEAMSMELAAVATKVSGIPELIEDGRSGLLVEPNNPQQMAEAVLKLARNPDWTDKLAKAGRERVKLVFNSIQCVDQLCGHFAEIHDIPIEAQA